MISVILRIMDLEAAMMGRLSAQWSLFHQFRLDERVPKDHLLRRIDRFVTAALADIHDRLEPHYSEIGRPSIDPELMMNVPLGDPRGPLIGNLRGRKRTFSRNCHFSTRDLSID